MKKVLIALFVSVIFVSSASAETNRYLTHPKWVGDGFREISASNSSAPIYQNYRTPRFNTEQDCEDYIAAANTLYGGKNSKGYLLISKVHAKCIDAAIANFLISVEKIRR